MQKVLRIPPEWFCPFNGRVVGLEGFWKVSRHGFALVPVQKGAGFVQGFVSLNLRA
jgi:hypothetical protein